MKAKRLIDPPHPRTFEEWLRRATALELGDFVPEDLEFMRGGFEGGCGPEQFRRALDRGDHGPLPSAVRIRAAVETATTRRTGSE